MNAWLALTVVVVLGLASLASYVVIVQPGERRGRHRHTKECVHE